MRGPWNPFRAVLAALGLAAACVAGFVSSGFAAGEFTVPGTSITITTGKDGKPDLSGLPIPTTADGQVDTAAIAKLLGVTLPPGISIPSGAAAGGATTPTATTPSTLSSTTTPGAETTPTTTTPPATSTGPDLSGLLGGAATNPLTQTTQPTKASASDERIATLLLVVFAGVLLACALLFAGARFLGLEPLWWSARRHEVGEASWRLSGGWADFRDWFRRNP